MNFIRYDRETGDITSRGFMDPEILNQEINAGAPILKAENAASIDPARMRVNPETKAIVPKEIPEQAPQQQFGPTGVTFMQFMDLFTSDEKAEIVDSQNTDVKLWLMAMSGAMLINMSNPDVKSGLSRLVAIGVIDEEREDQILHQRAPN